MALLVDLVAVGVPAGGSLLYATSLGALGFVFAGVAAASAQVVLHGRGVYAISLGVLVLAYLLRGVGDVLGGGLVWSTGAAQTGRLMGAVASYLPPVLVLLGVALLMVAAFPKGFVAAWVVYGFTAVVAFLGSAVNAACVGRGPRPDQPRRVSAAADRERCGPARADRDRRGAGGAGMGGVRRRGVPGV